MHLYLPIAEMSVNALSIILLGGLTGLLAGLFGVGGGFLTTPLLIFMGISPAVAVASSACQIIGSSLSGFLTQWQRKNVDFQIGSLLLAGGVVGSALGILLFNWLQAIGLIDFVISVMYVLLLGSIGSMMGLESWRALKRKREAATLGNSPRVQKHSRLSLLWHLYARKLPWKRHFSGSNVRMSALLPIGIGVLAGTLVSMMGIGGGFFMIPAMIYLLGMPTSMVVGTSLFQILFVTTQTTILHAVSSQTVDIVLATLLLVGGVIGAQFGTRLGTRLQPEMVRALLAAMVVLVALRLAFGLFIPPENIYAVLPQ
jgi:uncharacterized membrane protein YfcA